MDELLFKTEHFEGPLDLLEHLIRKNKLDICALSLVQITDQYIEYINKLKEINLEVSSEFLVVASDLLLIKSKALLPRHEEEIDEEDEAKKLTEALRERHRMRIVAEKFKGMQYDGTYFFFKEPQEMPKEETEKRTIESGSVDKLYEAFMFILDKARDREIPHKRSFDGIVNREPVSVKDKATGLIRRLRKEKKVRFENIFAGIEYKHEVVAIFLAVLELMKLNRITVYEDNNQVVLELDNENFSDDELLSIEN